MANEKMVSKEFTAKQIEIILNGLLMLGKSLNRRVVAEDDADARAVWQRKVDEVAVLQSKIRS